MSSKTIALLAKNIRIVSDSITRPGDTTAYTAGDVLAEVTTNDHLTFSGVLDLGKTGEIVACKALVSSYVATGPDIDLMLFSANPGEDADNAPATITDAEMANLVGIINLATGSWIPGDITAGAGGNQAQIVTAVNMPIILPKNSSGFGDLYGVPIMRNAYVPTASEVLTVTLYVRQD